MLERLTWLFVTRGVPKYLRSDNGSEFTCTLVRSWLAKVGVRTLFIEPGSPWENGYVESFNGKLRDELLDREIFYTLWEAKVLIECWREHYNRVRPHSSLGYLPPAPEAIAFEALAAGCAPPAADLAFGGCRTNVGSGIMDRGRSRVTLDPFASCSTVPVPSPATVTSTRACPGDGSPPGFIAHPAREPTTSGRIAIATSWLNRSGRVVGIGFLRREPAPSRLLSASFLISGCNLGGPRR